MVYRMTEENRSDFRSPKVAKMTQHPDDAMFSIKLVSPQHLDHSLFMPGDGQSWMNFSDSTRGSALADGIKAGHRALVYVTQEQKFIWAIEYTGPVQNGEPLVAASGNAVSPEWSRVFLPIRFLATNDLASAPDAQSVLQRSGVTFRPYGASMYRISADEYQRIYDAIEWEWREPA